MAMYIGRRDDSPQYLREWQSPGMYVTCLDNTARKTVRIATAIDHA